MNAEANQKSKDYKPYSMPYVDALVIGAGIYGLHVAETLDKMGISHKVVAKNDYLDYEEDFYSQSNSKIEMASLANQARVHLGYHYPRSEATVDSCLRNFDRFVEEFNEELIEPTYWNHNYALAKSDEQKTELKDWKKLIAKIDKKYPHKEEPYTKFTDQLEGLVNTQEKAMDTFRMMERKTYNYIKYHTKHNADGHIVLDEIKSVIRDGNIWKVTLKNSGEIFKTRYVFNCTYSGIKEVEKIFKVKTDLKIKYQICELALFTSGIADPKNLDSNAITIMDGPFASLMPFSYGKSVNSKMIANWSLTSVCHTPHLSTTSLKEAKKAWTEGTLVSAKNKMLDVLEPYTGRLDEGKYKRSIYTVKAINDKVTDDGRCVEFGKDESGTFFSILSGKLSTIYEVEPMIREALADRNQSLSLMSEAKKIMEAGR